MGFIWDLGFGIWDFRPRERGAADGDAHFNAAKCAEAHAAENAGDGDTEEHAGAGVRDTAQETFQAHAGVDDDGHRAVGEESEDGGDEGQALAHHHEHAVTGAHTTRVEVVLPGEDFCVEFGEGEGEVGDGGAVAGMRIADCGMRIAGGRFRAR